MKKSLKDFVEEFIDEAGCDLKKRLPHGFVPKIARYSGESVYQIRKVIDSIKEDRGLIIKPFKNTIIHDDCRTRGLMRKCPHKEQSMCEKIVRFLLNLPYGGDGMLTGTPTAMCVSDHTKYQLLSIDNLDVATILRYTTDRLNIIVGNGFNEEKAIYKARWWKTYSTTNKADIKVEKVDRESFARRVEKMAKKCSLCKVVLLTSGAWNGTNKTKAKYSGLDVNFRSPSEQLTRKYPGLHILAMTVKGLFKYEVRYLHNGINKTI